VLLLFLFDGETVRGSRGGNEGIVYVGRFIIEWCCWFIRKSLEL
jgi:hypothetical protein